MIGSNKSEAAERLTLNGPNALKYTKMSPNTLQLANIIIPSVIYSQDVPFITTYITEGAYYNKVLVFLSKH